MFDHFDEDKDGKLTENEVPTPLWQRISRADKDGDKSVTKDEMRTAIKKRFERKRREKTGDRGRAGSSTKGRELLKLRNASDE